MHKFTVQTCLSREDIKRHLQHQPYSYLIYLQLIKSKKASSLISLVQCTQTSTVNAFIVIYLELAVSLTDYKFPFLASGLKYQANTSI